MTSPWNVIVPEAAAVTNLVTNPSIEVDATGYTAIGSTLGQSSVQTRRGCYSLSARPTASTGDGLYYTTPTLVSGSAYTASVDFWGAVGVPYMMCFSTTGGDHKAPTTTFTGLGYWKRYSVTWTADANAAFRIDIIKNNSNSIALFYIDGLQLVRLDHDTSYIDGDQEDCYWTGVTHASTSIRNALARSGGKAVSWDTYGMTISDFMESGTTEIGALNQPYALLPGTLAMGEKILPRTMNFAMDCHATTAADLHNYRGAFINTVKPDRSTDPRVWLEYTGGDRPVRIRARYTGGFNFPRGTVYTQRIGARFYADDPYFYEDGEGSAVITTTVNETNANDVIKRIGGTWFKISADFNAAVYHFARGLDNCVYIGGAFTNVGDVNGDYIVKWNQSTTTLSSLSTGMNGNVYALAASPSGDIYAGGAFTLAGGVANTVRIAYWDWDNAVPAWTPLSTGIGNGEIWALCFDQSGNLYVGGTFTNITDANGDYITKWNGTAFASLSASVLDARVYAITCAPNGDIYVGGAFTAAGATTLNGIGKWSGSAWSALGTGVAGGLADVYAVAIDKAGNVYIGGSFTSVGGVTASNIAKWNGANWEALGDGVNDAVWKLAFNDAGLLYVGGAFTSAGGITFADRMAIWNGTAWAHVPCNLPGSATVLALLTVRDDLYIGYDTTGTGTTSYKNTVTNTGTATTYPKITIKRAGGTSAVAEYLKNETTGATLYLNYSLLDGETLILDTRPTRRGITSSLFGNVMGRALLPNSDFSDFCLLPGDNSISAFVNNAGATITAQITWPITHHSIDGSTSDNVDGAGGGAVV